MRYLVCSMSLDPTDARTDAWTDARLSKTEDKKSIWTNSYNLRRLKPGAEYLWIFVFIIMFL